MMRRGIGLALVGIAPLWATHYLGGDLTYECLGPNPVNPAQTRYRVVVTIYRDCKGISMHPITVYWRSVQCGVNTSVSIPMPTVGPGAGQDVTPVCSGQPTACASPAAPYGIQRWVYDTIISLPTGCGNDWVIWHYDCCRSNSIDNLSGSGGQGTTLYAFLDNTVTPCNSSPRFTNLPQFFNCVNRPTLLNLGITDPDGDSLVISLTDCLNSAAPSGNPPSFTPTTYISGRSGTNPFPTSTGFLIQPGGLFNYIATQVYQAAFCYKVEEYRNGVKIGETFQDVYLVIQNCPNLPPPAATTTTPNRPPTLYDETNANTFIFTAPVCPGQAAQQYCMTFRYRDTINPAPQNQLRVTIVQTPPGSTVTLTGNNTNNAQVQLCWAPTAADIGDHVIVITVENNGCPIRTRIDYTYLLRVRPGLRWDGGIGVVRGPGNTVITRDTTVCLGTQLPLYLTVRDSVPNASDITNITWTTTGGLAAPPSFPPPPLSAAVRPTVMVTGPGEYIATVTFRGGCTDRDTLRVQIFPPDTVQIQEPIQGCVGETLTLSATSALGLPIEWYTGAPLTGTLIGTGNSISYIVPPAPTGNVPIYALTRDNNGCLRIDTAVALFNPGPTFTTQVSSATCRGIDNGSIIVTPDVAGSYIYTLYTAGGAVVAGPQPGSSFTGLAPGSYVVLVQGPAPSICTGSDTLFVGQGDSVSVRFLGDSIRYGCAPLSLQLEAQGASTTGAALTYTWSFGDGNTQTTTSPSVSYTFSGAAQYIVVVRASTAQGCFATDTLIVDTRNAIGLNAVPGRICRGAAVGTVSLTASPDAVAPISYQATPVTPGAGPGFGPQNNGTFTGIPVGVPYEFIAQDARNCQGRLVLTLTPTDSVEALNLTSGPIEDCTPVAIDFAADVQGTGTLTYIWNFGNGTTATTSTPTVTGLYPAGGIYMVQLIVQNDAGCADTIFLPIDVPATGDQITAQLLSVSPVSSQGCVPLTVEISATGSSSLGSPLNFYWEMGDGTRIPGTQATHTYTSPGTYTAVFYAQSAPRCYDTVQVTFLVDGLPTAQIIAPPQPSSLGYYASTPLTFTAASGPYNRRFFWRADSQAASTGPTYTISYLQKGTFCVYLTVESDLGCVDSTSYCFDVSGYALLVPNVFTPNGDGMNDRFVVIGYGMESLEMTIYDRWGNLIHTERGSEQVSWDGTKGGTPVPEGAYVYVLRYRPADKPQVEVRTGTVTLLR